VDEPTDRALKIQGLKRPEYDAMSTDGKAVVSARSRRLTELANIAVAAELLNMMGETDDKSKAYVREVIEGKHPDFEERLRGIISDYLDANVDTNIRDYYKIRYGKPDPFKAHEADASRGEVRQSLNESAQHADTKTKTILETMEEQDIPSVQAPPMILAPTQGIQNAAPTFSGKGHPSDSEGRRRGIAVILSQWEKKDSEYVMRTEADVIEYVMTVTDENRGKGLTDETVCRACETMIKTAVNGVQFYREALMSDNREDLVRIANAFVK
jgi:hypothetical protein